jgi:hypothetical protein
VKAIVKLSVVMEGSISVNCPVGPRVQRGESLPMWEYYCQNHGYYFEPNQIDEAQKCAEAINKYIEKNKEKKGSKKK